ncbi:MAG: hypothetical protein WKF50_10785, partial [Nocardioides sp.]
IGGDIGALVVTMPLSMVGLEIEIRPVGHVAADVPDHSHDEHGHGHGHGHGHLPHVAVVRRPVPQGGEVPSLVFPELVEGCYELLDKGSDVVRATVEIRGGEVSWVDWPA